MNFKQFIQNLYSRCFGLLRSPMDEWTRIKEEQDSIWQIIIKFILPLLMIAALASMVGGYIHREGNGWGSGMLIIAGLRPVLGISVALGICIPAISAMMGTFGGTPQLNTAAKLVFFTFIPVLLSIIILGIWPEVFIVGLFSLYSYYIIYFGTQVLADIPAERQSNFSMLAATMILVVYLIINFILTSFFGAIH